MNRSATSTQIPSPHEARSAEAARAALAAGQAVAAGDLPPIVTRLLMDILRETAAGKAIALLPIANEVTTQQAADILNVSRPFLVGLVEKGVVPARKVGKHRRLHLSDVLAYKSRQFEQREQALDEMAGIDQELGLL